MRYLITKNLYDTEGTLIAQKGTVEKLNDLLPFFHQSTIDNCPHLFKPIPVLPPKLDVNTVITFAKKLVLHLEEIDVFMARLDDFEQEEIIANYLNKYLNERETETAAE